MKTFIMVVFFLFFAGWGFTDEPVQLKELTNPLSIAADDQQIYITEEASVFIYSRQDIKFIKKFGRKGEGPGEFKLRPDQPMILCIRPDDLAVKSSDRLSYFSKDGTYKTETKTKPGFVMAVQPFGKKFVGFTYLNEMKIALNIYDEELSKEKELLRVDEDLQRSGNKFLFYYLQFPVAFETSFITYEDKIYVTWGKDDKIKVFDQSGKKVAEIPVKSEKPKLSQDYKDKVADHFKNDKKLPPPIYERYYKNMVFPEFFPAIRDMRITEGKIYVVTYQNETGKALTKTFIFDIKGELLKTVLLPLKASDIKSLYPFAIKNDKLYQLVEDADNENWYLQITDIK